ncbi:MULTISPECIES: RyR domain-containing protein [unclassified Fusibacter]|uniref:RyR domain-containing protein n=1 Tax=unclassified Fusibacter TaxID=2624464 RepID=UPI001011B2C4|nr:MULTISPECIES: RyR domain-containing protein [unclassified Fusibacter]MCK8061713.1 RyR domain-containing protein [Fusibacter sp. A2]NPE23898.1 Ryanodine receptor Ryr [Fusibacter sp. A1]RXV58461.1 Ryanodine receptor Ryr [Fusibacter sp. A1]
MTYKPSPINVNDIDLTEDLELLVAKLSKNTHEIWSAERANDGWVYGTERNDKLKTHPCLVPYNELPENEKKYDQIIVENVIKAAIKLGYNIKL